MISIAKEKFMNWYNVPVYLVLLSSDFSLRLHAYTVADIIRKMINEEDDHD